MGVIIAISLLILIGILLLLLEFFVIPGTTIAAIGGLVFMAGGVYLTYDNYGSEVGNYVLWGTLIFFILTIAWALRSGTWRRFMLNTKVDGIVSQTESDDEIKIGDTGICISRLNPMGRVRINGKSYEAYSPDAFLNENTKIIVSKVESNKLIVKQIVE